MKPLAEHRASASVLVMSVREGAIVSRRNVVKLVGAAALSGAGIAAGRNRFGLASARADDADSVESLARLAQKEGSITLYATPPEPTIKKLADAFAAKYGIKVSFLRLAGSPLAQRYAAEAEAGSYDADILLMAGNSDKFAREGLSKGWIVPIADAKIPTVVAKEFPEKFVQGVSAVVQVSPWGIAYNSDKVGGSDIPRDWNDLANPKFKGQAIIPDPASSESNVAFWSFMLQTKGASFFGALSANNPIHSPSGIPAIQSLAAGDGSVQMPVISQQVNALKSKGAPIEFVAQDVTTGVEINVVMTNPARAKHPSAARLLANFILSREGNMIFNDDAGAFSVYDIQRLPKQYVSPDPNASVQKDEVRRLLGYS